MVGESSVLKKYIRECQYVNGLEVKSVCTKNKKIFSDTEGMFGGYCDDYDEMLSEVDAVYIVSKPEYHYEQIKKALDADKHVLCESPIALSKHESIELFEVAKRRKCILMDSLKTAYSTAYARLLVLIKSGKIGDVYSVDSTCTSLQDMGVDSWNSICGWGPTAMLPVFNILGTDYCSRRIVSHIKSGNNDLFTKISFEYNHAVASIKVGKGVKSEGELVVSGTLGYVYVPAPWWKTDYFEIRYEDSTENKRYFYQLDGEGIRYELVAFKKAVESGKYNAYIDSDVSDTICEVIESYYKRTDFVEI